MDDPTILQIVARPDLTGAVKTVFPENLSLERVTWLIQVANRGTVPANNVIVKDHLPLNLFETCKSLTVRSTMDERE